MDYWLIQLPLDERTLGVSSNRYPALAVTGEWYPPLEGQMLQSAGDLMGPMWLLLRNVAWGTQWGQLDDLLEPVVAYAPGMPRG